jgi:hypothetical protein
MVTVYQVSAKYALNNNLPPFSRHQLSDIGNFISTHFKHFWAPNQTDEIITQAGFVRTKEDGKNYLVCGYPDCFEGEMIARIDVFIAQKKEAIEKLATKTSVIRKGIKEVPEKPKRKRIPIK